MIITTKIQPNKLDIAFHKLNIDDHQKVFLLKNNWSIPPCIVFPLTDIRCTGRCTNERVEM